MLSESTTLSQGYSYRTQGILETSDLFLAVWLGIVVERSLSENLLLLFGIESVLASLVILAFVVLVKYRRSTAQKFGKLTIKGVRWVAAVFAGALFGIGYSLMVAVWPLGILYIAFGVLIVGLFFVAVAIVISLSKTTEESLRHG